MAVNFNDNIRILAPKPNDVRYLNPDNQPYLDAGEVNSTIPVSQRYEGLTVLIGSDEYWYSGGVGNSDLVLKISSSSGGTITLQNVGVGEDIFVTGSSGQLRSIAGSGNTTVFTSGDTIVVSSVGGSGSSNVRDVEFAGSGFTANSSTDFVGVSGISATTGITIFLPSSPALGQVITFSDLEGVADTSNLTKASKIRGFFLYLYLNVL
jgi:hypothetical protein